MWAKMVSTTKQVGESRKVAMQEQTDSPVNLNGSFHHKVDAKGRMSLPASFRKVLPTDLVVTIDPYDECLRAYVTSAFNAWVKKVFEDRFGKYDETNKQHVRLRAKLKERAVDVSIDAAGRIMIPAAQRKSVGIKKNVVVCGNEGYFEIWDEARHNAEETDIDLSLLFPDRSA